MLIKLDYSRIDSRAKKPNIAIIDFGLPILEGMLKARKEGFVAPSCVRFIKATGERVISDSPIPGYVGFNPHHEAVTGTMFAYGRQGIPPERFAKDIPSLESSAGTRYFLEHAYEDSKLRLLFPVPPAHLGTADSVLVCEPCDYLLEKDRNYVIALPARGTLERMVDVLHGLPAGDGRYAADSKHGIPLKPSKAKNAVSLRRGQDHTAGFLSMLYSSWNDGSGWDGANMSSRHDKRKSGIALEFARDILAKRPEIATASHGSGEVDR